MTSKEGKMHLPKVTLDDFLSTQEERDNNKLEKVQMIAIDKIVNFPNHPYKIKEDEDMINMAKSIKELGVIHPVLVRPKEDGTYEMISGHRRKRASEIAEKTEIRAIVKELTDEEAVILMVDSNNQREQVLPSEKAFAYKMKLEAMKRQAGRPKKENSVPLAQNNFMGKTSREILSEQAGESQDQIRRYIRLTELIPQLLDLVDEGRIKLRPAVEISYLTKDEQIDLLEAIECLEATPSHYQAIRMREKSEKGELTTDEINKIMEEEKPNQREQIKFKYEKVKDYFPRRIYNRKNAEDYREFITKISSPMAKNEKSKRRYEIMYIQ